MIVNRRNRVDGWSNRTYDIMATTETTQVLIGWFVTFDRLFLSAFILSPWLATLYFPILVAFHSPQNFHYS
jgi:hypothetical protein